MLNAIPDGSELFARHIAALEAQNRQLRRVARLSGVGCALLALLVVAGWKAGGVQDVVKARSFQLVDDRGLKIGEFGIAAKGNAVLDMDNADGYDLLFFGSAADDSASPIIRGYDRSHDIRFDLGISEGGAGLTLDSDGIGPRTRVRVGEIKGGEAGIFVAGQEGKFGGDYSKAQAAFFYDAAAGTLLQLADHEAVRAAWSVRNKKALISFFNNGIPELLLNMPPGKIVQSMAGAKVVQWPPSAPVKKP